MGRVDSGLQTGWTFLRKFPRKVLKHQHFHSLYLPYKKGLQIRGGKVYFSIGFLEFSIENKIEG